MEKKYLIIFCFLLLLVTLCFSCSINVDNIINYGKTVVPDDNRRVWSILIYMAADNDLEYAAIEDIYEMECSKLNTDKVSVFILVDRSKAYDTSNDNWTGTRLYQLKTGRDKDSKDIISKELSCPDLGLKKGTNIDLDMSSEYVLANSLMYIRKTFPADNLGFIMWGHGTGWRCNSGKTNPQKSYKGFAHDDSSACYMTLKQFGNALKKGLNGEKLDFLGLDTCFSGEIEVMYELRNYAHYAVGSEGLVLMSGWNYKNIFNNFEEDQLKTSLSFTKKIIDDFTMEYGMSTGASIVGINMEYMSDYFRAFDEVMKEVSLKITSRSICDDMFNILLSQDKTISYSYGKEDSDVYLDINSIFKNFANYYSSDSEIIKKIDNFTKTKNNCVVGNWASHNTEGGVGVYFGTLTAGNLISTIHPAGYIKNKTDKQIKFVTDSNGYISSVTDNNNFLGKLFYTSFNN